MLGLIASNNFLREKGGEGYFLKKLFFVVVVTHAKTWIDRLGN